MNCGTVRSAVSIHAGPVQGEYGSKLIFGAATRQTASLFRCRPLGPAGGLGLKPRDPTWTAQQVFHHSWRNAQCFGYLDLIFR